ncbi:MAG: hypothetical protein ACTHMS_07825 [Jatrophihabitans sp.]|uniref:hypothetical protein n=1 Tax=Jatrophihabitans sp. TaxID=1932789 RepID=UPI003F808E63
MDEFGRHAGWCARGQPGDGRRRLDLFPDYAAELPVWDRGVGRSDLQLSPQLRADLAAWGREWEQQVVPFEERTEPPGWRERWTEDGRRLGRRLEAETGCVVVVLEPDDPARADDCPQCGRPWLTAHEPD